MVDSDKREATAAGWLRYIANAVPLPDEIRDGIQKFFSSVPELTIHELVDDSWQTAEDKGWHSIGKSFGEDMALLHSEVSEALEEYRNGHRPDEMYHRPEDLSLVKKPEGVPSEFADILIRVGDICKVHGIDLEAALRAKMAYNKTRPHLHGGKKL